MTDWVSQFLETNNAVLTRVGATTALVNHVVNLINQCRSGEDGKLEYTTGEWMIAANGKDLLTAIVGHVISCHRRDNFDGLSVHRTKPLVEIASKEFWCRAKPYLDMYHSADGPFYYLDDSSVQDIPHEDNSAYFQFPLLIQQSQNENMEFGDAFGFTVIVNRDQLNTDDVTEYVRVRNRPRAIESLNWIAPYICAEGSLRRSALLNGLATSTPPTIVFASEKEKNFHSQVVEHYGALPLPGVGEAQTTRLIVKDPFAKLERQFETGQVLKVFTDLPSMKTAFSDFNQAGVRFEVCEKPADAQIIHQTRPIQDFVDLPQKIWYINQFPFESCLVRKDILPQTVRKYCYTEDGAPTWWLPVFDFSTELAQFLHKFRNSKNTWILKTAQGTHSDGMVISNEVGSLVSSSLAPGGDRVCQKYIEAPLLVRTLRPGSQEETPSRKFDIRSYVLVRSFDFEDPEVYLHNSCYARVAAKPFSMTELREFHSHLTVASYDERSKGDHSVGGVRQQRFEMEIQGREDILKALPSEVSSLWETEVEVKFKKMISELFHGAARQIGPWPRSRAVYGVDWMCTAADLSPKLLEVNFAPDFTSISKVDKEFASSVIATLYTPVIPHEKLTRIL